MPIRYFGRPIDSKLAQTGKAMTADQAREMIDTDCWFYYAPNRRHRARLLDVTVNEGGMLVTMTLLDQAQPLNGNLKVLNQLIPKDGTMVWDGPGPTP